jgi:hypothetical protein
MVEGWIVFRCMDGWMHVWMHRWMHGWIYGWRNEKCEIN